jgi:hypothetical protein
MNLYQPLAQLTLAEFLRKQNFLKVCFKMKFKTVLINLGVTNFNCEIMRNLVVMQFFERRSKCDEPTYNLCTTWTRIILMKTKL